MHIETLEAVNRESKRLPPIQKVFCPDIILSFIVVKDRDGLPQV